ncbi:hypothetical protein WG66_015888 [Moniliophthora roreri]|nr:hypothetical protein WG66_015888 [Moniliophthora roreri]
MSVYLSSDLNDSSEPAATMSMDPFVLYSRSLHDYTLRLWTESRRLAEEKARARSKGEARSAIRRSSPSKSPQPVAGDSLRMHQCTPPPPSPPSSSPPSLLKRHLTRIVSIISTNIIQLT